MTEATRTAAASPPSGAAFCVWVNRKWALAVVNVSALEGSARPEDSWPKQTCLPQDRPLPVGNDTSASVRAPWGKRRDEKRKSKFGTSETKRETGKFAGQNMKTLSKHGDLLMCAASF